ncbi:unnamed protein product [Lampetra planeri]
MQREPSGPVATVDGDVSCTAAFVAGGTPERIRVRPDALAATAGRSLRSRCLDAAGHLQGGMAKKAASESSSRAVGRAQSASPGIHPTDM